MSWASKIFAMSSVTEGLPKVLLEAMASGCACVATDVGECRGAVADAGLIVAPQDAPAPKPGSVGVLQLPASDLCHGRHDLGEDSNTADYLV